MELETLAQMLSAMGCPVEKAGAMAQQLDRKARMDGERKRISYELALQHLIGLLAQGWAVKSLKHSKKTLA